MKWYTPVSACPETDPFFDLQAYIEAEEEQLSVREKSGKVNTFYIARDREKIKDLRAIQQKYTYLLHYNLWLTLEPEFKKLKPGDSIAMLFEKFELGISPQLSLHIFRGANSPKPAKPETTDKSGGGDE